MSDKKEDTGEKLLSVLLDTVNDLRKELATCRRLLDNSIEECGRLRDELEDERENVAVVMHYARFDKGGETDMLKESIARLERILAGDYDE